MASEIRVDKINSLSGVGTVTLSPTGVDIAGITTVATFKVGTGVTASSDGDIFATGVTTSTTFSGSGASLTNLNASNIASGTVPTARLGSGTASSSTFLRGDSTFAAVTSTTINSNAANRVILGSDTANTLNGESNLTFSSNTLTVHEASLKGNQLLFNPSGTAYIDHSTTGQDIQFRTSVSSSQDTTGPTIKSTGNIAFASGKGIDFSATSDASGMSSEVLDDYEKGSWNPIIGGWDTATYYSGSSYYSGWYIKIGDMIHVGWKIYYQNLTTPTSGNPHVRITGLPYNSNSVSSGPAGHVRFDIPEFGFSGYPLVYLAANDSVLYMYKHINGANNLAAINATSNYSNNWTMGTATYYTV